MFTVTCVKDFEYFFLFFCEHIFLGCIYLGNVLGRFLLVTFKHHCLSYHNVLKLI